MPALLDVLLVGNYEPDGQESMLRYAMMLQEALRARGHRVHLIRPIPVLGRLLPGRAGMGKWLGYVDKFLIFPFRLRLEARRIPSRIVHICDHSNAMYVSELSAVPHVVTCHDVLAIRSARGDFPCNSTGLMGRGLQAWILRGLRRAQRVICVSEATRTQVMALDGFQQGRVAVVHNALNYAFIPICTADAKRHLAGLPVVRDLGPKGFIFHVGGNQWYKNRPGVLRIYFWYIRQGGNLPLVMAGESFTQEMDELVSGRPQGAQVIGVGKVSGVQLNALYSQSACLFFPSLYEGYGWPLLEALSAGTRVVATGTAPLSEVGGKAVEYIDVHDEAGAALILHRVTEESLADRAQRIEDGKAQAALFSRDRMVEGNLDHYRDIMGRSATKDGDQISNH